MKHLAFFGVLLGIACAVMPAHAEHIGRGVGWLVPDLTARAGMSLATTRDDTAFGFMFGSQWPMSRCLVCETSPRFNLQMGAFFSENRLDASLQNLLLLLSLELPVARTRTLFVGPYAGAGVSFTLAGASALLDSKQGESQVVGAYRHVAGGVILVCYPLGVGRAFIEPLILLRSGVGWEWGEAYRMTAEAFLARSYIPQVDRVNGVRFEAEIGLGVRIGIPDVAPTHYE